MEEQKSLKTSTLVSKLPDPVQDEVHNLLADGVVAPGVVVGGVLLAGDELLGMEELPVDPGPHLVDDGRLQVHKDGPGDVLASTGLNKEVKVNSQKSSQTLSVFYLGEEGVEAVITAPHSLVRWHAAIRLDSVLQAVKLPASVTNLDTSLGIKRIKLRVFTGKLLLHSVLSAQYMSYCSPQSQ